MIEELHFGNPKKFIRVWTPSPWKCVSDKFLSELCAHHVKVPLTLTKTRPLSGHG